MEVLNDNATLLTNFEVLSLLNEVRKEEAEKENANKTKALGTIVYQTSKYLADSVCASQASSSIEQLIRELAPFKLTAAEILQIINLRPSSATEVQIIVEESEDRLQTQEVLSDLIEVITRCLPPKSSAPESQ